MEPDPTQWVVVLNDRTTWTGVNNTTLFRAPVALVEEMSVEAMSPEEVMENGDWEIPLQVISECIDKPTLDGLIGLLALLFRNAVVDMDNQNQVIIYTDLRVDKEGNLKQFEPFAGYCDVCDKAYDTSSNSDHCVECGNCIEHCVQPQLHFPGVPRFDLANPWQPTDISG